MKNMDRNVTRGGACPAADLHNYIPALAENRGLQSGLLATWGPLGSPTRTRFTWLGAGGLQHGRLRLDLEKRPASDTEYLDLEAEITAVQESREHIKCMVRPYPYIVCSLCWTLLACGLCGRFNRGLSGHAGNDRVSLPPPGRFIPPGLQPYQRAVHSRTGYCWARRHAAFSPEREMHHAAA